jgi:hypothetical protein
VICEDERKTILKLSRVSMALWLFVVLMACNLGTSPAPTAFPTSTIPVSAGKPQVSIVSVAPSGTVRVNQRVDVTVQITDTVGATRFQMTANGRVVKTLTSATSAGETNRTLVMDFTPNTQGVVTLVVTASRADGTQSDPAQTQVQRPTRRFLVVVVAAAVVVVARPPQTRASALAILLVARTSPPQ